MTGIYYTLRCYFGYCFFFLAAIVLPRTAFALYSIDNQVQAQLTQRASMSVFTRNDSTIYMYGGFLKSHVQNNRTLPGGIPATNMFDAIHIDPRDGNVRHIPLPSGNAKVGLSQAIVFPDHVLFIGGYCQDCFNTSSLLLSQYFFDQQRWTFPLTFGDAPPQGIVSATLAGDGKVYIRYQQDHPDDFWSYDPLNGQFENLGVTLSPRDRYLVRFSWKLPNGDVAFLAENDDSHKYSLDILLTYSTSTRSWGSQRIGAKDHQLKSIPHNKRYFGIANDQRGEKIYLYGGVAVNPPYGGYSTLNVLDTSTWTWEAPHYDGASPRSQYRHGMVFINEKTLVLVGGIISSVWELRVDKTTPFLTKGDFWCDHINVLRVSNTTSEWVINITQPSFDELSDSSENAYLIGPRTIVVIIVASVSAITISLTLYIFRRRLFRIATKFFRMWIWSPRMGEPKWTEAYRLLFKIILGCSLTGLLAVNVSYALNSPLVTINYITQVNEVAVPDIRICIRDTRDAFLMCETETLSSQVFNEMGFIRELNTSFHRPAHVGRSDEARCYMFAPDEWFRLTRNNHATTHHNGSRLLLRLRYSIRDSASNSPNIYLSLYARERNPNRQVYFNEKQQLTQEELTSWLDQEKFDIHQENQYTLGVATYSMINYQHQVEETLVDSGWNTIGFASDYHTALKLKTELRTEPVDPLERGTKDDNSSLLFDTALILYPKSFTDLQTRQQKIHTFVTLLGVMGGALALFTTCMVILFGARPASPWGFVQQMSTGDTRRSFITSLHRQFHPWAMGSIPFVDAVMPPRSEIEKELLERHAVRYRINDHNEYATTFQNSSRPQPRDNTNCYKSDNSHSMAVDDALEQLVRKHTRAEMQDIHSRLQLMELVFKWYYIDHEVFDKLALAMQSDFDLTLCHTPREWNSSSGYDGAAPYGTPHMFGSKSSSANEDKKKNGFFKSITRFFTTDDASRVGNVDQEESAVMQRLTMYDQAIRSARTTNTT